jgi:hypothetical protein
MFESDVCFRLDSMKPALIAAFHTSGALEGSKPAGKQISAMNLQNLIDQLRSERDTLNRVIREIEGLCGSPQRPVLNDGPAKRRGRKSMGPDERLAVSARMKSYWAGRNAGAPSQTKATVFQED